MFAWKLIWMCANCSRGEWCCLDLARFSELETHDARLLLLMFICSPSVNQGLSAAQQGERRRRRQQLLFSGNLSTTPYHSCFRDPHSLLPLLPTSCYNLEVSSSFQVNVTGSRLVMTLPKYVRLQQSDTVQECAGCVGVALVRSEDPPQTLW